MLHTFYQLGDESYLAFFEAPQKGFEFKEQHDFDLHIALEVSQESLQEMFKKGKEKKMDVRGISDHGFIDSIYFRDPNGYVLELTAKRDNHDTHLHPDNSKARDILDKWSAKQSA